MDIVKEATKPFTRTNIPPLRAGDVVRVHERIQESTRTRTQVFEGLIIARRHGSGINATFTVRRIASRNVGVERVFPIHSPAIEKIEILRHEKVRRGKLNYVRNLIGRKTRRRKATQIDEMFSFAEEPKTEDENESEKEEQPEKTETAAEAGQAEEKIEEAKEEPEKNTEIQEEKPKKEE